MEEIGRRGVGGEGLPCFIPMIILFQIKMRWGLPGKDVPEIDIGDAMLFTQRGDYRGQISGAIVGVGGKMGVVRGQGRGQVSGRGLDEYDKCNPL